jgi:Phage tail protein (Tail_P2_I)
MKDLFSLLPTVHRVRDAAQGDPLRALLNVVNREVESVEDDIGRLYDNWFIETCDEWVVPYIADLLGVKALPGGAADREAAFSQRSFVANTLAYRRRKGTAAVLEQLATDITGWRCKAVEFFERTASSQHVNHPRPDNRFTVDVRNARANALYGTPFEQAAHLAEVRHIDNGRGRYNVPNVGLFLWRLQSYFLQDVSARRVDAKRYLFDPLGRDVALFNMPQTEATVTHATQPANVPMPLSRLMLRDGLRERYGDARTRRSLLISVAGVVQPVSAIAICNLSDAGTGWTHAAPAGKIAIDPELGRVAFDVAPAGEVSVSCAYGFGGDLGGGPYDRRPSLEDALKRGVGWQMGVSHAPPPGQTQIVATLGDAVKEWNKQPAGIGGVIALMDSRTYQEDLTTAAKRIRIPEGSQLLIVAAGWPAGIVNGAPVWRTGELVPSDVRTHVRGTIEVIGTAAANSASPGRLVLNGVLVEGALKVLAGNLGTLQLAHCTLAPGISPLSFGANPNLSIGLTRVMSGDVAPGMAAASVHLSECITDGGVSGRDVRIDASTIFGTTQAQTLNASNSICLGKVTAERRQEGCVRFSYLPFESESPRRYRCQPDDVTQAARLRPRFESTRFGDPAYAQLATACASEIVSGADDEGEMGAWHFVQAPLRLRGLRLALDEYLRFGLEAGTFIVPQQPKRAAVTLLQRTAGERESSTTRRRAKAATRPARSQRPTRKATTEAARKKQRARTARRTK